MSRPIRTVVDVLIVVEEGYCHCFRVLWGYSGIIARGKALILRKFQLNGDKYAFLVSLLDVACNHVIIPTLI